MKVKFSILTQTVLITVIFSSVFGRRRGKSSRDVESMSYSPRGRYSSEFAAAYRRAADLAGSNTEPTDSCYDIDGKAKKCLVSEFGNIAIRKKATATSTCGDPPMRYCNRVRTSLGGQTTQCYVCDANHKDRINPAEFITDANQKSCWVSQLFKNSSANNEVSVTISLGKKYELTYVILPFCNKLPESMALYKSADFGYRWIPLQFYSSDCENMYGLEKNGLIMKSNEQEAVCKDHYSSSNSYTNTRIAFSLVEGRPSAHNLENSPVLRDWVTVTDIKIVFNRLSAPKELATETEANFYSLSEVTLGGRCKCNGHASRCITDASGATKCDCKHNTDGRDCERCKPFHYNRPWNPATDENANECVACNCNLHSSKCIFSKELYEKSGKLAGGVCVNCRHNTNGINCQKCSDGHYRDLTVPLTHRQACKACDCNNHTKKCIFSKSLYILSGKIAGGVCIKCRHKTSGNRCQYCKIGFHRDMRKPISHRRACKACKCHPYGSLNKDCGSTGQCSCKKGVTGLKCDRCKPDYVMTKSITQPCQNSTIIDSDVAAFRGGKRIPIDLQGTGKTKKDTDTPVRPQKKACNQCKIISNKLNLQKYCRSLFAIKALVKDREGLPNGWVRFSISVDYVYKKNIKQSKRRLKRDTKYVYVREDDLRCKCPKIRMNKMYIMIGVNQAPAEQNGLLLDRESIVVRHKGVYDKRMKFFKKEEKRRRCFSRI